MDNKKITKIAAYVFSGGMSTLLNLGIFSVLARYAPVPKVAASAIAFAVSVVFSFFLQKNLTFKDRASKGIAGKAFKFFLVNAVNICLNTLVFFLLSEALHFNGIFSQLCAGVAVAFSGYFMYGRFVFSSGSLR